MVPRRGVAAHPELVVIAAAAVALRLPTVLSRSPLTFDDGVYLASVGAMRDGGLPFRDVYSSQGPALLPVLWLGDLLSGRAYWGPRLAPLVAAAALVVVVHVLARRTSDRLGAALAATLVATSGWVLFSTGRVQSDGLAAAFAAGAVLAASEGGRRRLLAATLLIGTALAIKSLFAVPAALTVLWLVGRREGGRSAAVVLLGVGLLNLALAARWGVADVWHQSVWLHLRAGDGIDPLHNLELLRSSLRRREPALVVMTAAAAVAAVWPSWRATTRAWRPDADLRTALWIWLGSAGVLLLAHDPLYLQHLMVVVPPASILLAAHRPPALVAVAVLLATLPLQADGAGWRASRRQPSPSEATVIDLLVRLAPADGLVISDEPALPWLAGRTSPGSMVDLSYVRIESGDLDADDLLAAAHRPGVCAVLIWTPRLAQLPGQRAALEDYRPVFHSVERVLLVRDGCTIQPHPDRRLLRLGYSI